MKISMPVFIIMLTLVGAVFSVWLAVVDRIMKK